MLVQAVLPSPGGRRAAETAAWLRACLHPHTTDEVSAKLVRCLLHKAIRCQEQQKQQHDRWALKRRACLREEHA